MNSKDKFYKVYNNLPLKLRDGAIVVIDNETISWRLAKLYIDEDTKLGEKILDKLDRFGFI